MSRFGLVVLSAVSIFILRGIRQSEQMIGPKGLSNVSVLVGNMNRFWSSASAIKGEQTLLMGAFYLCINCKRREQVFMLHVSRGMGLDCVLIATGGVARSV